MIRESSALALSTSSLTGDVPAYTPVTTTPIHASFPTATGTGASPGINATYTTSPPPEFTGGAARVGGGLLAVAIGAVRIARFF